MNDHWEALPGSTVRWQFVGEGGRTLSTGETRVDIAADRLSDNGYRFVVE